MISFDKPEDPEFHTTTSFSFVSEDMYNDVYAKWQAAEMEINRLQAWLKVRYYPDEYPINKGLYLCIRDDEYYPDRYGYTLDYWNGKKKGWSWGGTEIGVWWFFLPQRPGPSRLEYSPELLEYLKQYDEEHKKNG